MDITKVGDPRLRPDGLRHRAGRGHGRVRRHRARSGSRSISTRGFAGIEKSLAKFAEKGTLKETPQVSPRAA